MTFDIGDGVDSAVNYILDNFAPLLDFIAAAIGAVTNSIQALLLAAPMPLGLAVSCCCRSGASASAFPSSPPSRSGWSSTWACGPP